MTTPGLHEFFAMAAGLAGAVEGLIFGAISGGGKDPSEPRDAGDV
ncbi:hypothetical protein ABIA35_005141 [Catenulispora sp. MAP12-49]